MTKTMLERVLLPLDGSTRAESIVPLLEPILQRSGSEIFLVRALAPSPEPEPFQEADQYLKGIADRFLEEGVCAHTMVGVGSPIQVIESLAHDEEITLIAMSTQGGSGDDADVGPVTERMLRGSSRPVLALRPAPEKDGRRPRFRPHRSLLAPLDGSEASRRSLPLALELAGALDARVILMRVIERPSEKVEALHDLHDVAARLNRQGLIAEVWIESGDPGERILQVCRDEDIQLIVLTTQGRSGMSERLFGSVTRQILKQSPVPVLAVHVRGCAAGDS
jgi:nucleotide-binding universal stress UspA family protein